MNFIPQGFNIILEKKIIKIINIILVNEKWTEYNLIQKQYFNCPNCKENSTYLKGISDVQRFENLEYYKNENYQKIKNHFPYFYKILECKNCESNYFFNIGYEEPNYGRDVFYIQGIYKI